MIALSLRVKRMKFFLEYVFGIRCWICGLYHDERDER